MKPRVCIMLAYTPDGAGGPWQALAELVLPRLTVYAQRHGHALSVLEGGFGDAGRAYPWQKTDWVASRLAGGVDADFVWVLDLDTLITNPAIDVADFADDAHDLFIGEDVNGMNAGSYLLRVCDRAQVWCRDVLKLIGTATSENHAMILLDAYPDHIRTRRVVGLNSIPYDLYPSMGPQSHSSQWKPGHLLMHLPGMTPADRVRHFREVA